MPNPSRRNELKLFLRARRDALPPSRAGTRAGQRRRTPGLRREEVAALAGVSVTWYTWLEQGRDIQCSEALLRRLARALLLSESDTAYLFRLAGHAPPVRVRDDVVDPAVQAVYDAYRAGPALTFGPRLDVLACNAFADAVFRFDDHPGPFARNQVWRGFMDPKRRRVYVDWIKMMSQAVALLRTNYAARVGDANFEQLIAALTEGSAEFRALWQERRTTPLPSTAVRLRMGALGQLNFVSTRFALLGAADHIAVFLAPSDEQTEHAVRSWSGAPGARDV